MSTLIKCYYADYFSLVLPFSGVNNGTSFTDRSPRPKPMTRYGNTKTVTSQFKHYGSSGYFDGSGGYLASPYHADFDLSTCDFTLDSWVYRLSQTSGSTIYGLVLGKRDSGADWDWGLECNNGLISFRWGDSGTNGARSIKIGDLALNAWAHVAVVRKGNVLKTFLSGLPGSTATIIGSIRNRLIEVRAGRSTYPDSNYHGYLQDLRLLRHHAAFETAFDPLALSPAWDNNLLDYPGDAYEVASSLVDLRSVGAPLVTLVNWDEPDRYAQCRPGADRLWNLKVPHGIKYGLYYLSSDTRCPPIIHGPYTAE